MYQVNGFTGMVQDSEGITSVDDEIGWLLEVADEADLLDDVGAVLGVLDAAV